MKGVKQYFLADFKKSEFRDMVASPLYLLNALADFQRLCQSKLKSIVLTSNDADFIGIELIYKIICTLVIMRIASAPVFKLTQISSIQNFKLKYNYYLFSSRDQNTSCTV